MIPLRSSRRWPDWCAEEAPLLRRAEGPARYEIWPCWTQPTPSQILTPSCAQVSPPRPQCRKRTRSVSVIHNCNPFSMIPCRQNSPHIRDADVVGVLLHVDGSATYQDLSLGRRPCLDPF